MSKNFPYTPGTGELRKVFLHFRSSFPAVTNADTLKKLGYASKNEFRVINTLRFLGLIDQDGNKTEIATKVFNLHDDSEFNKQFSDLVKGAYKDLFDLHNENAWALTPDSLISFFRTSDSSTEVVGGLQAKTFLVLSGLSGYGKEELKTKVENRKPVKKNEKNIRENNEKKFFSNDQSTGTVPVRNKSSIGLTVRIEINLPVSNDQETYNKIFRSIKENFINEE